MNLESYDWIVVNSSAGKDSQAMLDLVVELAGDKLKQRIVVAHADLGRVEWPGTKELAAKQAAHYGLRFEVVKRSQGDLLDHILKRGKWPSPKQRYCTSDHKRDQVSKLLTRLAREYRQSNKVDAASVSSVICDANDCHNSADLDRARPAKILNCIGIRAQESPARSKLQPFKRDERQSNGRRIVDAWLPIHDWSLTKVWDRIKASGVEYHYAYGLGMPRLSCCFCIYAPRAALMVAGKHNPELLETYVQVEKTIKHKFRLELPIVEIQQALASGEVVTKVKDWKM